MKKIRNTGHGLITVAEDIGLFLVAIATIIAMSFEVLTMVDAMRVTLADLLLLFIYLEVLAMIGIYLKSGKLPVRMPIYITIVALARYIILDMKNIDTYRMLGLAASILILAVTVLVIRYGHHVFPYDKDDR